MRIRYLGFSFIVLICEIAQAAALVPVLRPSSSWLTGGLEVNRGQANPEVLFLCRGDPAIAVTAQSVLFSPLGARMSFVAGNPNPAVRFFDALPGVVNSFTGADPRKWVTGIPRYATAVLAGVYQGIDVRYAIGSDSRLTLRLQLGPGADPKLVVLDVPTATDTQLNFDGSLSVRFGTGRIDPALRFLAPVAFQPTASGGVNPKVSFKVQSATRFGLEVSGQNSALHFEIEIEIPHTPSSPSPDAPYVTSRTGEMFVAATVADDAGKNAPFPANRWSGCETSIATPMACTDVAVFKFSPAGQLVFSSYLTGRTRETASFVGITPDGVLVVTGNTDSDDFPVTAQSLQGEYGGPKATFASSHSTDLYGDFFAARLNPDTGALLSSTYFGGPSTDSIGQTALGADGSVYLFPKWLGRYSAGMPISPGALQAACAGAPCTNAYAAHLSPSLDRLLYGTYLPGNTSAAKLHSDGSLYYAGSSVAGFPVTSSAYQREPAGGTDGIVARLNALGTALIFATYLGGPEADLILRMAVAPDGSVWTSVSSFVQCCVNIRYRLVRLDSKGERIVAEMPIDVGDLAVDKDGNLLAIAGGDFSVSPDALLANACSYAYLKLSPGGEQLFATYLPANSRSDFAGTSARGLPLIRIGDDRFEVIEGQSMGVFAGCLVDGASFGNAGAISPGGIVTLFGSGLGPRAGVGFQLVNGRVPAILAGTRVLVNGEPVPILYASYWQVNAILPYSLPMAARPKIQVESNSATSNELGNFYVQTAGISLFRSDASPSRPAAALNEDGSVNSPFNPAKKGSRMMLFGTGGGATVPRSVAGEVTPLELRVLAGGVIVKLANQPVAVEWAGAAPGLLSGITQINIKLPDVIPTLDGFPRGVVPLFVETQGASFYPGYVTVAVDPD